MIDLKFYLIAYGSDGVSFMGKNQPLKTQKEERKQNKKFLRKLKKKLEKQEARTPDCQKKQRATRDRQSTAISID